MRKIGLMRICVKIDGSRVTFFANSCSEVEETDSMLKQKGYYYYQSLDIEEPGDAAWEADYAKLAVQFRDASTFICGIDTAWQYRESARMLDGTYRPLPQRFGNEITLERDHFAHLPRSDKDTSLIAFTESNDAGKRDVQKVMKIGRYLRQYKSYLLEKEIQDYVRIYREAQVKETYTLHFARDRKTIARIFETEMCAHDSSTPSCMFQKFGTWKNRPYFAYAGCEDVQLAYMTLDHGGNILARSVVRERKDDRVCKGYVRIYTVRNSALEAESLFVSFSVLLAAAGYSSPCSLLGTKLSRQMEDGELSMPYLDGGKQHIAVYDDYVIVVSDNDESATHKADCVDGRATILEPVLVCADCDYGSVDELNFTHTMVGPVCASCFENFVDAIYDTRGNTQYYREDSCVAACDDNYYALSAINRLRLDGDIYHVPDCGCEEETEETEETSDNEVSSDTASPRARWEVTAAS